jgi:hypothetical protein
MLNLIIKIIFGLFVVLVLPGILSKMTKKRNKALRKFILLSCQLLGGAIIIYSIAMSIF